MKIERFSLLYCILNKKKKGKIYVDSMASLIFYVNFKLIVLQKG